MTGPPPVRFGLCALAAAVLLAAVQPAPVRAATPEARVKAAYLYKMASFVRWPAGAAGGAFRICIAGRQDIAGAVADLTGNQQVEGRPIAVTQLGARNAAEVRGCQILFLGRGGEQARNLLAAAGRAPVLTVTDRNNGSRGGAVEFVVQDGKVRFLIDRSEAESRALELSSKLLDVAAGVAP